MRDENTLFNCIYDDLKSRILTGQFAPGGRFPSVQGLRDEYLIGFRTAREITQRLKDEGLIEISPRKAPVVSSKIDTGRNTKTSRGNEAAVCEAICAGNCDNAPLQAVLNKDLIREIYEAVELLLPLLISFALKKCNIEFLPHYKKISQEVSKNISDKDWRNIFMLCQEILRCSGNPIISDLYISLARYCSMPLLFEDRQAGLHKLLNETGGFLKIISIPDNHTVLHMLMDAFEGLADTACEDIKLLEADISCKEKIYKSDTECMNKFYNADKFNEYTSKSFLKESFQWNTSYSYIPDYRYTNIMSDLIFKIFCGFYQEGTYLPHEAELAREYNVSLSTLRKALHELQELNLCKTINVKGTLVLSPGHMLNTPSHMIHNANFKKKILLYLYALQFMAIIIKPISRTVLDNFTSNDWEILLNETNGTNVSYASNNSKDQYISNSQAISNKINIAGDNKVNTASMICRIVDLISSRIHSAALRTILAKPYEITQWNYSFSFISELKEISVIENELKNKILYAISSQSSDALSHELAVYHLRLLAASRSCFAEYCQFAKAGDLMLPDVE